MPQRRRPTVSHSRILARELSVLGLLCTDMPPYDLVADPERGDELQQWVLDHLRPEVAYATGISILDAAAAIARSQIDNGMETLKP